MSPKLDSYAPLTAFDVSSIYIYICLYIFGKVSLKLGSSVPLTASDGVQISRYI